MRRLATLLLLSLAMQTAVGGIQRDAVPDTRMLGKAVDYFASGKYHEALTLFVKLDKKYKLNPRFMAYIGICYYHEQEYAQACRYLDTSIPSLSIYAPAERGIYYHAAADSHFKLEQYAEAIPFYEMQLLVCRKEEKADILYNLGFCYMFQNRWAVAADMFTSSLAYYQSFTHTANEARLKQLGNMIKGCLQKAAD